MLLLNNKGLENPQSLVLTQQNDTQFRQNNKNNIVQTVTSFQPVVNIRFSVHAVDQSVSRQTRTW